MTPHRVLAAVDSSEQSNEVILQADARARMTGAELVFCTVVPSFLPVNTFLPMSPLPYDVRALTRAVKEALRERVARLTQRADASVDVRVLEGVPHAAVVEEAERFGADLLVIGSHGRTGLARVLLGSVAERIMRYASCSVLVARPRPLTGHILVATDFSDPAVPAIRAAVEEAKNIGGKLTAVHVIDVSDLDWASQHPPTTPGGYAVPEAAVAEMHREARQRLVLALSSLHASGDALSCDGEPALAIVSAAQKLEAQLIVVGTAGRTGLRRVVLGSVAEAVVRKATTSVLVVRLAEPAVA